MRRILDAGIGVPLVLAAVGVALIVFARVAEAPPAALPSLPPIVRPSPTPQPPTGTPRRSPTAATPTATPTPTPVPDDWVAVQLEIRAVQINVRVYQASGEAGHCDFPPLDGAYVLCGGSQPGRDTNSFIFAHARVGLFLNLWNVRLGDVVLIRMSDGAVLEYVVTEVHANVPCPDPEAAPHPNPPPALRGATDCFEAVWWTARTDHERLTLQTSQGLNRNWGEFIVVAEPSDATGAG